MTSEALEALVRANLAGAAAALALLALRGRLRPLIGPSAIYALWLAVPAAAVASLLPPRTVTVVMKAAQPGGAAAIPGAPLAEPDQVVDVSAVLLSVWLAGAVLTILWSIWRQHRFSTRFGLSGARRRVVKAASDRGGPAVVGVLFPRILLPADFADRFSPTQRRVVLAHEGVHLTRGDSRINAAVLLLQCLSWFNPIAHLAARAMRLDQELSCDALVMARFPKARRAYAEAMLKSQTGAEPLPMGCYWPARAKPALVRRLTLLRAAPVSRGRMAAGVAFAVLTAVTAALAGWSVQAPRQRIVWEATAPSLVAAAPAAPVRTVSIVRVRRTRPSAEAAEPQPVQPGLSQLAVLRSPVPISGWASMPMPLADGEEGPAEPAFAQTGPAAPEGRMTGRLAAGSEGQTSSTYRNGAYQMKAEFVPSGEHVQVSAQLYKEGAVIGAGTATIIPGETAYVALSNGQMASLAQGETAYIVTPRYPYLRNQTAS